MPKTEVEIALKARESDMLTVPRLLNTILAFSSNCKLVPTEGCLKGAPN
jgi:hypothetical protein